MRITDEAEKPTQTSPTRVLDDCFIRPNGLRVVVKRDGFTYKGVLTIPERAKKLPTTGVVVSVPPSGELDFWLGRRVVFGMLSGQPIEFRGKPAYICLAIEEVLGEISSKDELELENVGGGY